MHHLCSESSRYYRNYSHLCDDKTVLKNPHKGWYYHFVDNGLSRPTYRDGLSDDEQLTVFPGMNPSIHQI